MSRNARRLVAWAVTIAVVVVALLVALTILSVAGMLGVVVLAALALLVWVLPRWWVFLSPDSVLSWLAALPALWRWADRGPAPAEPPAAAPPVPPASSIATRPAPRRW